MIVIRLQNKPNLPLIVREPKRPQKKFTSSLECDLTLSHLCIFSLTWVWQNSRFSRLAEQAGKSNNKFSLSSIFVYKTRIIHFNVLLKTLVCLPAQLACWKLEIFPNSIEWLRLWVPHQNSTEWLWLWLPFVYSILAIKVVWNEFGRNTTE